MKLTVSYKAQATSHDVSDELTMGELFDMIDHETHIPPEYAKLLSPGAGVITLDKLANGPDTRVADLLKTDAQRSKILLMGTPIEQIQQLQETEVAKAKETARRLKHLRKLNHRHVQATHRTNGFEADAAKYTFHRIEPLPGLPHPERSRALLERLRDDRGVRAIMVKHQFSVGVLSELDPASSTSHSSRLLGLNTGAGQMIQLRLRTDDYEGYCSYKEIRKVLCHELTHNVHGDHDRKFWDLFKILEREVVDLDPFGRSGNRIGEEVYDGPGFGADTDELLMCDEGGWFGSTQRLGSLNEPSPGLIVGATGAATPTTSGHAVVAGAEAAAAANTNTPAVTTDSIHDRMRRAAEARRQQKEGGSKSLDGTQPENL